MKRKKQNFVTYKREKDKVIITGDPKYTKGLIWVDMISSKFWIILVIILLLTVPKASFLPMLWVWIKKQTPFLSLIWVLASWWLQMLLSG